MLTDRRRLTLPSNLNQHHCRHISIITVEQTIICTQRMIVVTVSEVAGVAVEIVSGPSSPQKTLNLSMKLSEKFNRLLFLISPNL